MPQPARGLADGASVSIPAGVQHSGKTVGTAGRAQHRWLLRIFTDKVSGTLDRRPQLDALLATVLPGDKVWR